MRRYYGLLASISHCIDHQQVSHSRKALTLTLLAFYQFGNALTIGNSLAVFRVARLLL